MNRVRALIVSVLLLAFIAPGCAPRDYGPWAAGTDAQIIRYEQEIRVQIDSLADPDADSSRKIYMIESAMQGIDADDLQFKEFARQLERGLARKGYIRTRNEKEAQLLIRLAYGMGEPRTSTVTTSYGYSYPVGWWWFYVPPSTEQVTKYMRTIFIEAVDLKNPDRKVQVWKMTLKSEGGLQNMRQLFPFLIAAAVPYFGTNLPSTKMVKISPFDKTAFDIWRDR